MFPARGRPFMLCSGLIEKRLRFRHLQSLREGAFLQFYYKFFTDAADVVNRMLQLYAKLI